MTSSSLLLFWFVCGLCSAFCISLAFPFELFSFLELCNKSALQFRNETRLHFLFFHVDSPYPSSSSTRNNHPACLFRLSFSPIYFSFFECSLISPLSSSIPIQIPLPPIPTPIKPPNPPTSARTTLKHTSPQPQPPHLPKSSTT